MSEKTLCIQGYASVFNVQDKVKDIVQGGAFTETIDLRGKHGWNILIEHDAGRNLGRTSRVVQNHIGLYAALHIPLSMPLAQDVLLDIKLGLLKGLSIGYRATRCSKDDNDNRLLHAVNLLDIALVSNPANDMCKIDRWYVFEEIPA